MASITYITEKIMEEKPFLQECLSKGLINVFALAEHIHQEVKKEIKQEVKVSAIMMALRRLNEKLQQGEITKLKLVHPLDFLIKSDVVEITITNDKQDIILPKLYSLVNFKKGDFLTITQGLNQTTIITDKKNKTNFKKLLKSRIVRVIDNLSLISIRMPEKYLETEGVIYQVTRELAWHKLNIVEIVSTLTEISLVLYDEDIPKSYKVLKDLFNRREK